MTAGALDNNDGDGQVGQFVHPGEVTTDFFENSYLSYIVPFSSNFDPESALGSGEGPVQRRAAAVEQRDLLFFDETVNVFLILQTPCTDERTLRAHLGRLVLSLQAQIINNLSSDRDVPPSSEVVFASDVADIAETSIIFPDDHKHEDGADQPQPTYTAVWKLPVLLARPKIRLQSPSVVFSGTASLRPPDPRGSGSLHPGDGYLQSCVPLGMNLLEGFAGDPALGGVKPHLSAQRVSRVAPATKSKDSLRRIQGQQSLKLKIYPVLHTRVRFARPNTTPPSAAIIALLETDFTPFFDCEVSLDKITLTLTDGSVDDLNTQDGMALPLSCVAHDHLTFLYRLEPHRLDPQPTMSGDIPKPPSRDLVVTIEVSALVRPDCTPRLAMSWTTPLDFTLPLNPGFGQPMTQPIQRSHRPSQLSIGGGVDSRSLVAPSVSRPDALPSLEAAASRPLDAVLPDFGITMTFTGPREPVHVGDEFSWSVFVANRSRPDQQQHDAQFRKPSAAGGSLTPPPAPTSHLHPVQARRLMLVPVPRRRRGNDVRAPRPASVVATVGGGSGSGKCGDPLVADAVLDEAVVHAMQRSSIVDSAELACLSAEVRVGPLAPNACAVAELRFLALREGVVGVDTVKVVDLGTQEHVDVRDLPVVVVRGPRKE